MTQRQTVRPGKRTRIAFGLIAGVALLTSCAPSATGRVVENPAPSVSVAAATASPTPVPSAPATTAPATTAPAAPTEAVSPPTTAPAAVPTTKSPAAPRAATTTAPAPAPARTTAKPPAPEPTRTADPAGAGCYPKANSGNCYKSGQFCRASDHNVVGRDATGRTIKCVDNNGWRWDTV
ncbi:hypothetical protein [Kitasatospora sp. NPDC002040]|uniref:hypothetical protein n=1 Tax=Kitasatospora sp. NPDC002040 TaxID=3154661 RepID=UPI00331C31DD